MSGMLELGVTSRSGAAYTLVRARREPAEVPELDEAQLAVVEHRAGAMLVMAGPGTGKTTTIVEAVAARIAEGANPERILVLTFARAAAAQLRDRIAARVGGALREPLARTFHSYAFGLLHREALADGEPVPRLLSGPEQQVLIRELIEGDLAAPADRLPDIWPARLWPAMRTRGFVQELRDLMMRAYERGITPRELARLGRAQRRDDWVAAARFMRQYDDVTALSAATSYDPAELIRAVVSRWLARPDLLARERAERPIVFVDELQDIDPAQAELLRLLCGGGQDLVAVGDRDQSIYAFRGADPGVMGAFPAMFATDRGPVQTVALSSTRRSAPELLAATRRIATRLGPPSPHRDLVSQAPETLGAGDVDVALLRSPAQEAAYVASRLRAAHLQDGVPWSRMVVLVRSARASLPVLRRALASAGCPVATTTGDVLLAEQPVVAPLLTLLRCALDSAVLDATTAADLVASPFGGADAMAQRRLGQALRRAELADGGGRTSGALLVETIDDPRVLLGVPDDVARPARTVARALAAGRDALADSDPEGRTVEQVLWRIWDASGLAARLERRSRRGGDLGAAADRALDAVVAVFEAAARFVDRLPSAGPGEFLEHLTSEEIPRDTALGAAGEVVQVLTAHASKGLEWDVVAVAGVQEGTWPTTRLRGSFLGSERLVDLFRPDTASLAPDAAAVAALTRQLQEERRLFYVALTRARRRLLVTAVANEREGLAPSRFLDELDPVEERPFASVPPAATLRGLVTRLRRDLLALDVAETEDDSEPDSHSHSDAAGALATLAAAGVRGADPATWWGLAPLSDDGPLAGAEDDVRVSPSKVDAFSQCQLRWFLEQAGGSGPDSTALTVGNLVHAVAQSATDAESSTEEALSAAADELLATADLGTGWWAGKEAERTRQMVARLAHWIDANPRELVDVEVEFTEAVGRALVTGRVDRLERDAQGRAYVVDFKTGSTKASDVEHHPQLATYQLVADEGAFAEHDATPSGGAALVQLGKGALSGQAREQAQEPLAASDDPAWARELVLSVADGMAGSAFDAIANDRCKRCPVRTSCPLQDEGRQVVG